ncbi:MAG: hypothetical protein AAFQ94_04970 [Bacteroidota bacterium]
MSSQKSGTLNTYEAIIRQSISFLSAEWKGKNGKFIHEEYIAQLSVGLVNLFADNWDHRLPQFDQEVHSDLVDIKKYFEELIVPGGDQLTEKRIKSWCEKIENAPFHYILTLMGQRFTSASARDITALPPSKETLLRSSFRMYNDQICMVTRAWEKHIGRSDDQFWGEMKGSQSKKDEKVKALILRMIDEQTWWNVFFHYKHELVYEIRVASGHGARWNCSGTEFIGFLEPFLQE